jgi:hypothetical protein
VDSNGNLYEEPGGQPKIVVVNSTALNQVLSAEQRRATSVIFNTSGAWTSTISEGADLWIAFDPLQGNAAGRYTVSINLEPNSADNDRTAVFTIRCGDEEVDVTITQKASDGNENQSIEDYLNNEWDLLQRARAQALAEDREPLSPPAVHKFLFVACTNVSLNGGVRHIMDERQKQFFKDVVKNFEEVVELYSDHNVVIETEILIIDRDINLVIPEGSLRYVYQSSIQPELDVHAPIGAYDAVLVSAAASLPGVILGVKTAGYENLYGYSWFQLVMPKDPVYTIPAANEAPWLSTCVAVHEWMHQLEFFGGLLNIIYPPVHAYFGGPDFPGYTTYQCAPGWDFACYYRDCLSGRVPYSLEGNSRQIGMFPLMWRMTPRFFNKEVYIMNEGNGMYLTRSGNITSYSATPYAWYLRYNGDNRFLILTDDNRTLDIVNASNGEGNAVNIFGVNGAYPQAQNWRISKNSDGTYKLTTTFPTGTQRVLQRNTSATYPTGTTINTDNGSVNQKWRLLTKPL